MKYITLIICLLSFGFALAQGTAKKTSKPEVKDPEKAPKKTVVKQSLSEFRKIRWGTRMDSIMVNGNKPVFVKATDFGKSEANAFYIENEDLTIGTISLQKILYVF